MKNIVLMSLMLKPGIIVGAESAKKSYLWEVIVSYKEPEKAHQEAEEKIIIDDERVFKITTDKSLVKCFINKSALKLRQIVCENVRISVACDGIFGQPSKAEVYLATKGKTFYLLKLECKNGA